MCVCEREKTGSVCERELSSQGYSLLVFFPGMAGQLPLDMYNQVSRTSGTSIFLSLLVCPSVRLFIFIALS